MGVALHCFTSASAVQIPVDQGFADGSGKQREVLDTGQPGWAVLGRFGSLLCTGPSLGVKLQVTQHHASCCWCALTLETHEPQISPLIPLQTHFGEQMVKPQWLSPQLVYFSFFCSATVNFVRH